MAISTITYANKVALNENESVADINKVKADDMNEIKSVVNNNANETSANTTNITNLQTYSTSEINTGKIWIDGKLIYRKVFIYNNTAISSSTSLSAPISGYDSLIKTDFYFREETNIMRPFPTIASGGQPLGARWQNNNIQFSGTDSWSAKTTRYIIGIIEYTKTS